MTAVLFVSSQPSKSPSAMFCHPKHPNTNPYLSRRRSWFRPIASQSLASLAGLTQASHKPHTSLTQASHKLRCALSYTTVHCVAHLGLSTWSP
eukprot:1276824-Pyramimonas_sp.AAC.1